MYYVLPDIVGPRSIPAACTAIDKAIELASFSRPRRSTITTDLCKSNSILLYKNITALMNYLFHCNFLR